MSSPIFAVQQHSVPTSHIREYARSTQEQDDTLHLAVKQYTPQQNDFAAKNEITIIGAHANGFPKEMYEPLWDDLYNQLKAQGIRISNIFIADVAHQGASGVMNERLLGNDPSWQDHPRDLFLMVNHFRQYMKRPIVGIGHSMGGNNLVNLSLMHPRLFTTLILMDPVLQRRPNPGNFSAAKASVRRRDRWPSRQVAAESFKKSKFYQSWDPRVLDKWLEYGLRELPTALYPQQSQDPTKAPEATLTTTVHQEVLSFMRANFASEKYPFPSTEPDPINHPDLDADWSPLAPFARSEPHLAFQKLPGLRPSVRYIFGGTSGMSSPDMIADKVSVTGVGIGGSGGARKGRVDQITLKGIGHLVPMESVNGSATAASSWIVPEVERWRKLEDEERQAWTQVPKEKRSQMTNEYITIMKGDWNKVLAEEAARKAKL